MWRASDMARRVDRCRDDRDGAVPLPRFLCEVLVPNDDRGGQGRGGGHARSRSQPGPPRVHAVWLPEKDRIVVVVHKGDPQETQRTLEEGRTDRQRLPVDEHQVVRSRVEQITRSPPQTAEHLQCLPQGAARPVEEPFGPLTEERRYGELDTFPAQWSGVLDDPQPVARRTVADEAEDPQRPAAHTRALGSTHSRNHSSRTSSAQSWRV